MTSLFGTVQAYQPMASTYLALAPECGDKIFGSNINYCNLVNWGIYDGQEYDPAVLNKYKSQQVSYENSLITNGIPAIDTFAPTSDSASLSNKSVTVYSLLKQLPHLSTMASIVEKSGWVDYLNSANDNFKVTLFAPSNAALKNTLYSDYKMWNSNNLRAFAQAHTLPFAFEQSSAIGRKLKLYTSLETFTVFIDGTGEVSDKLNFYIPSNKMFNLQYPYPMERINVVASYYTNNGALYEIDAPFDPQVIVY